MLVSPLVAVPVSSLVSDAADRDPVSGPENPSEWPEAKVAQYRLYMDRFGNRETKTEVKE